MHKPHIVIIGTGGTIVSSGTTGAQMTGYSIQGLNISNIVAAVPALNEIANLRAVPLFNIGSCNVKLSNWIKLALTINQLAINSDIDGFVVTHGTDTLEETAFFLHLTLKTAKPVVLTGSMRPATAISADGPLNLLNAVRLASSEDAYGKGVLVAMNGQIHSARDVSKTNTVAVDTFASPSSGPLGYIIGEQIDFLTQSIKPHTLTSEFRILEEDAAQAFPEVDIVLLHGDENVDRLKACINHGADGIILEATGNGSVPVELENVLNSLEKKTAIVRASRTGSGPVTQGLPNWQKMGLIPAGTLSAQKSRILLQLALHKFGNRTTELERVFKTY